VLPTVRDIYQRYLALPSVMALTEELKAEGIVTKRHVRADGSARGGLPFMRGPLHHLLSNPIYIGKVQHRGQLHQGQHDAIIDQKLWEAVQAKRNNAIGDRRSRGNSQHSSVLTGMIRDHADRPMSPSHAVKNKRRYRYYVSSMAAAPSHGADIKAPALRLPAADLEHAIIEAGASVLSDQHIIMDLPQIDAHATTRRFEAAAVLASELQQSGKNKVRQTLLQLGLALIVHSDRIEASISRQKLIVLLDDKSSVETDDGWRIPLAIKTTPNPRGRNRKLVLGSQPRRERKQDPELIALLRKAEAARRRLFASEQSSSPIDREEERLARLAFLSPSIVAAIMEGRQPASLTARRLLKQVQLPLGWASQRAALGF